MRVCLIGGRGHVDYALRVIEQQRDIRIVGVAPGSAGEDVAALLRRCDAAGQRAERHEDYRAMLDRLAPDIAVIAPHIGDHAGVAAEALRRRIHVFVEKPVATTLADLAMLKGEYQKAGVHLAAMLGLRYEPWFLAAKQAVAGGAVGNVRLILAQKSYKLGCRTPDYRQRATYGGTIPWVGSHAVDWIHWLSGERFLSVYAAHSALDNRGHGDLEMTALCHFTLTNQVFGAASLDYLRPETAPTHGDDRVRIAGARGVLEVRDGRVYLTNDETAGTQELPLPPGREIFADFLQQVQGQGPCLVSAEDSFYVTEACLHARESADTGEVVRFPGT